MRVLLWAYELLKANASKWKVTMGIIILISTQVVLFRPGWLYFGFSLQLIFQFVPKKNTIDIIMFFVVLFFIFYCFYYANAMIPFQYEEMVVKQRVV